jgi:hypothetical protein
MLRIVDMYLVTDVSGQLIAPTFQGQAVLALEYCLIGYPETSVTSHLSTMHNIPEESKSPLHCAGSLKPIGKGLTEMSKRATLVPARAVFCR